MAYGDQSANPDAGQRDGTETTTARLLFAGTAATVVLRGATWALSSLTIGPLLGVLDVFFGAIGGSTVVSLVQAVLSVAAIMAAMVCAAGIRNEPARFRRPVRVLAYVFVADVVIYLAPIFVVAAMNPNLTSTAWVLFLLAAVGNVGLAWLAIVIARRARPLQAS
jgi:hypothetical protein